MSAEPTGEMFTSTAMAAVAVQRTLRGLGDQPWLLAQSIIASPRPHSPMDGYMMALDGSFPRCGIRPVRWARALSGSSTGGVAMVGLGTEAHKPTNATPRRPRALSVTAGSGRARGLWARTLISWPIRASTLPPG